MNRLTRKSEHNINGYVYLEKQNQIGKNPALVKLGKLEDLEEQLGCPLEVVVKALKVQIYYEVNDKEGLIIAPYLVEYFGKGFTFDCIGFHEIIWLKDYKKTWWLKEDKSE